MSSVVSLLLVVAALAFVGWPLLRTEVQEREDEAPSLSPLERQKLEAYAAIKEAEFDLRMGKLSEDDFAELTERYRQQALAAIAAMEKEDRRDRSAAESERRGKRGRPPGFAFCPACGQKLPARANFCGSCGNALREAVA